MPSHRPYRAGLEEIGKGRGVHYDPRAVDAWVALFREKGFVFSQG